MDLIMRKAIFVTVMLGVGASIIFALSEARIEQQHKKPPIVVSARQIKFDNRIDIYNPMRTIGSRMGMEDVLSGETPGVTQFSSMRSK